MTTLRVDQAKIRWVEIIWDGELIIDPDEARDILPLLGWPTQGHITPVYDTDPTVPGIAHPRYVEVCFVKDRDVNATAEADICDIDEDPKYQHPVHVSAIVIA